MNGRSPRLDELFRKHPLVEGLITRLDRILHQLWLEEFAWSSIEVFAPIYELISERMVKCGLAFARHEEEWRIVLYEKPDDLDEAQAALERWTKPPEPEQA